MVVGEKKYDLAIIGGGILGLMSAYIASKDHPEWSIVLIDKKLIGNGATAYSAFLDMPYGKTEYKRNLTTESRKLFKEAVYIDMPEISVVDKVFIGYGSRAKLEEIESEISEPFTLLSEGHGFTTDKIVEAPSDQESIRCESGSYVETTPVMQFYNKLIQNGVRFLESVEVKRISPGSSGYTIETNVFGNLEASHVIEATGPFSSGKSYLSETDPIAARVKKIIAFHIEGTPDENAPISYFFDDDAFLIPQPNFRRWLFSYRCQDWDIEVDDKNFCIEQRNIVNARSVLKKYAPKLADYIVGGRVFCDLYSENGDPIVEKLNKSYVRIGASGGSGYRLAPGMAKEALNLILT